MIKEGVFLGKRYEILCRIGSGGMADVYKGKDHKLNRHVAIKVLKSDYRSDKVFIQKFLSEAQAAAGLMHPNVVNVYDVGQDRGLYYMVMELVEGITLKDYIEKKGRLSAKETVSISIQMVTGLQAAHKQNIIHRDIKPQNIIISKEGKVKVTDFGIARATTATQTISTSVMGSVHYTSPEQARGGAVDQKSDIYSVGITLYEMVTGHVPFDGDSTVSVALKHLQEEIVSPAEEVPDLPYSLECIIMKCTQKNAERRYHDCESLLQDLKRSLVDPDGDFVGKTQISSDTERTVVMSTEELDRVQRGGRYRGKSYEDDYGNDYDEDDYDHDRYDSDEDDYEDDYEERRRADARRRSGNNVNPDTKRIMKILMVVAGVVVALLVIFLAANAMGAFSVPGLSTSKKEELVEVPDLRGKTIEEARKELQDSESGLGLKVVGKEASSEYAEDEIKSQDPGYGEKVKIHTTIEVIVSTGKEAKMVSVPSVVGKSEDEAEKMLKKAGLKVTKGEAQYSSSIEEGKVISVNPSVGTSVEEGTKVELVISLGIKPITVPGIMGITASEAEAALNAAGLRGSASEEYSDTVEAGYVISQSIVKGTEVSEGTTVSYVVSLGPETKMVNVPSLSNCTEEQALQKLKDQGLSGSADYEYNSSVSAGYVIRQTASAGSQVEEGTTIGFTVSKGPEPQPPSGGTDPETPDNGSDTGNGTGSGTGGTSGTGSGTGSH